MNKYKELIALRPTLFSGDLGYCFTLCGGKRISARPAAFQAALAAKFNGCGIFAFILRIRTGCVLNLTSQDIAYELPSSTGSRGRLRRLAVMPELWHGTRNGSKACQAARISNCTTTRQCRFLTVSGKLNPAQAVSRGGKPAFRPDVGCRGGKAEQRHIGIDGFIFARLDEIGLVPCRRRG